MDGPRLEPRKKVGLRKVARSQILRVLENIEREKGNGLAEYEAVCTRLEAK